MNIQRKSMMIAALAATTAAAIAATVGQPAPEFELKDTGGTAHTLSDFKGKHVVLEWTNPDCPFVKKHYDQGDMQALQKEYTAKGVIWLSIASSAPGKQGHYTAEQWTELKKTKGHQSTAVLLDPDGKVGKQYDARTTPHMFVINPEGRLIYAGAIDDNPSTRPADVKTARNHVRAALDEAMSGQPVSVPSSKPYGCSVKY